MILSKLFLMLNMLSLTCFAASDLYNNSEEIKQALSQNPYEPNYFSMIFGLFLVILLIYLTGFLYQKLTKINIKNDDENIANKIYVVSNTPIGQNKNLYVIKVNEQHILIGATQNNITYIKDLNNSSS